MSIHLRRWGIALGLIAAFVLPYPITQAQSELPVPPQAADAAPAPAQAPATPAIKEVLDLRITAYTSLPNETDNTPFITADGSYVHDGIVATNLLPFGTKVMIPSLFGDKVFTVHDRMNRKFMDSMDIWMATFSSAIRFGVHDAKILVLAPDTAAKTAPANTGTALTATLTESVAMANHVLANAAVAMATGSKLQGPSVRQL